jgi:hypothetical protein
MGGETIVRLPMSILHPIGEIGDESDDDELANFVVFAFEGKALACIAESARKRILQMQQIEWCRLAPQKAKI